MLKSQIPHNEGINFKGLQKSPLGNSRQQLLLKTPYLTKPHLSREKDMFKYEQKLEALSFQGIYNPKSVRKAYQPIFKEPCPISPRQNATKF